MRISIAVSLFFLSGCMVGPNYNRPETLFSNQYLEPTDGKEEFVDLKNWWAQFNDPILNEMIEEAVGNNYDLLIAMERIEQVRAHYQFDSANLWPEIDLQGNIERERVSQSLFESPFTGPPVQNLFQIGFDASWELDLFGRLRRLREASYRELEASREGLRDVYITLIGDVVRNYATLRGVQKRIAVLKEQIEVLKEELDLSFSRYQAGLRSEIEPLETKALLKNLEAKLPTLLKSEKQSFYRLAVLTGYQPEEAPTAWLKEMPIPVSGGKIPIGMPSDLLRRRPDIREAERSLAAATSKIGAAIGKLFPTFSITGSFGFQTDSPGDWISKKSSTWSAGPNLFWPLIDFGRIRSQINLQNAVQKEALYNYEQTILKALEEVESFLIAYIKQERRVEILKEEIQELKNRRRLTHALFRAGLASFSVDLEAENQVLAREGELLFAEETLSVQLASLYKSLGGEWPCCSTP